VAMGLVAEGDKVVVLTDILGDEDHYGDMDFKVTGTTEGITALQMDIKVKGITTKVLVKALDQARKARLFIIKKILEVIPEPRKNVSKYAPKIETMQIKKDQIGEVIGAGGKIIRSIFNRSMEDRYFLLVCKALVIAVESSY